MIKSETKTFRYRIVVGSFIFFLLLFSCTLLSGSNDKDFFWMIVFNIMMFLISGGELWRTAKKITIDPIAEVINFTNLFTRKSKTYSFRDLGGYAESDLPSSTWYGTYRGCRVLYLVQNGYFIEIISSDIYSNMEELKAELEKIEFLCYKKDSLLMRWKILFNKQIIEPQNNK